MEEKDTPAKDELRESAYSFALESYLIVFSDFEEERILAEPVLMQTSVFDGVRTRLYCLVYESADGKKLSGKRLALEARYYRMFDSFIPEAQRSPEFRADFLQEQDTAFIKTDSPVQAEDFPYAFNYAAVTPFGAELRQDFPEETDSGAEYAEMQQLLPTNSAWEPDAYNSDGTLQQSIPISQKYFCGSAEGASLYLSFAQPLDLSGTAYLKINGARVPLKNNIDEGADTA